MSNTLRLFVGYDPKEVAAYHVLAHSIISRATVPVSITPLARPHLQGLYTRPRGPLESTDFSMSRFIVPALCDYQGYAVFMDSDMLLRADVAELWLYIAAYMSETVPEPKAVLCCQHDYTPRESTKFFGAAQTVYPKKNWSSFVIFANERCRALTPAYVNTATGLDLHRFNWLGNDSLIGRLPLGWNHLIGEPGYEDATHARNLHWTLGGPWLSGFEDVPLADEWRAARRDMLGESNLQGRSLEAPFAFPGGQS